MQFRYSRLYADHNGASCFADQTAELELGFAVPPAEPLYSAKFSAAGDVFWMGAIPAWRGDTPHPAPRRMAFVTVQGEYQITATNGETRKFPIGTVLLIEDTIGEGHMTKTSSTGNTIVFAVGLPPREETAAAPRREGGHIEIGHDGDG